MARNPTNLTQLEAYAKEEWANIPQETCRKLVDTYRNRLEAVKPVQINAPLVYGLLAIGFSFCISFLQSGILQFTLSMVGLISGGVLGVFILGVFAHRCNAKGAIAGFMASVIVLVWIKTGSVLYPSSRGQLHLSVEGCPVPNVLYTTYTSPTTEWTAGTLPGSTMEPGSENLEVVLHRGSLPGLGFRKKHL
ncbi:sodium-coupled monocarboxylate transporter 1-like [Lytechinus variegatus]|uniref:sodium-coupled monocarboxylate transporter 1-like n=1 Tax=Lytechinus variegatus TaxID=7654 RepID=UPI001BB1C614|nr:sodium-coupled monocarboxylate transporter 1-like [Lytechinus variegatus]